MLNKIGIYKMLREFLEDYTIKDRFQIVEKDNYIRIFKSTMVHTPYETLKEIEGKLNNYPSFKAFTFQIKKHEFIIKPLKTTRRFKHESQMDVLLWLK